jgi:hypothetical protein
MSKPEPTAEQREAFDAGYQCAIDCGEALAAAWATLPKAGADRSYEEIAEDYIAWCRANAPALSPEPAT